MTTPKDSPDHIEQEVFLNLLRLHERLLGEANAFIKEHGLTVQQYNVIRILHVRGGEQGLPCLAIAERLINRVPDITRLLDRMERDDLVRRTRSSEDRRVVLTTLTERGRQLADLHDQLLDFHKAQFAHLAPEELEALDTLLKRALEAPAR